MHHNDQRALATDEIDEKLKERVNRKGLQVC
jgi:hypothetical protein